MKRILAFGLVATALVSLLAGCGGTKASAPTEIKLDYAYYSPLSLVIKEKGWMEEEFKGDNIPVKWVLSLGSNKALEYLSTGGADFGNAAGAASLLAKANGNPIKTVYIGSKPEWTALVVGQNSTITSVKDLKGKKIAATPGTDPYIFLLRELADAGLGKNDVQIVNLQHPDGRTALEKGQVDAWAGLDPHMAASELQAGSKLIVRNPNYNTYDFVSVREQFAKDYPDYVKRVLKVYEKARQWALANKGELTQIVATAAKVSPEVAAKEIERNDFSGAIPGAEQIQGLQAASKILLSENLVKSGTDTDKVIKDLIDPSFAQAVVKH